MTGKRVRELRETYGMSQEELAHVLGVTATTIYRWERMEHMPRGKAQRRLLQMLSRHRRTESADRQHVRQVLLRATDLGVSVPAFLGDDSPAAMPAKARQVVLLVRELASL